MEEVAWGLVSRSCMRPRAGFSPFEYVQGLAATQRASLRVSPREEAALRAAPEVRRK